MIAAAPGASGGSADALVAIIVLSVVAWTILSPNRGYNTGGHTMTDGAGMLRTIVFGLLVLLFFYFVFGLALATVKQWKPGRGDSSPTKIRLLLYPVDSADKVPVECHMPKIEPTDFVFDQPTGVHVYEPNPNDLPSDKPCLLVFLVLENSAGKWAGILNMPTENTSTIEQDADANCAGYNGDKGWNLRCSLVGIAGISVDVPVAPADVAQTQKRLSEYAKASLKQAGNEIIVANPKYPIAQACKKLPPGACELLPLLK